MTNGFVVRDDPLGGLGGADGGDQPADMRTRSLAVMSDLRGDTRVVRIGGSLEVRGDPEVHAPTFGRKHLLVDGLADQAVAKAVRFGAAVVHQQPPIDGLLNRRRRSRPATEPDSSTNRSSSTGPLRTAVAASTRVASCDSPAVLRLDDLADRSGQPSGAVGNRQLFEEECIPAAAADDLRDDRRARWQVRHRADQLRGCVGVEGAEIDSLHARLTGDLDEERQDRVVALELVGPDCPDEQDTGRRQAANAEVEQVAGRPVGPLQVLDHHDDRPVGRLGLETVQDRFEQTRAPDLTSLSGA